VSPGQILVETIAGSAMHFLEEREQGAVVLFLQGAGG